jgi:hypothetical protein
MNAGRVKIRTTRLKQRHSCQLFSFLASLLARRKEKEDNMESPKRHSSSAEEEDNMQLLGSRFRCKRGVEHTRVILAFSAEIWIDVSKVDKNRRGEKGFYTSHLSRVLLDFVMSYLNHRRGGTNCHCHTILMILRSGGEVCANSGSILVEYGEKTTSSCSIRVLVVKTLCRNSGSGEKDMLLFVATF